MFEAILLMSTSYFSGILYYARIVTQILPWQQTIVCLAVLQGVAITFVTASVEHFRSIQSPRRAFNSATTGVSLGFALSISIAYLGELTDGYSRAALAMQFIDAIVVVLAVRLFVFARLRSAAADGRLATKRVVLIGDYERCTELTARLATTGIQVVAAFPLPRTASLGGERIAAPTSLVSACRKLDAQEIFIVDANANLSALAPLVAYLSELPVGLHIVLTVGASAFPTSRTVEFGEVKTLQVAHPPLSKTGKFLKRMFDIVAAGGGLVFLAPLFLTVSFAIKLDSPGPVFYRQQRHGYNDEIFSILKFRTMRIASEADGFRQAQRNDSRVTRVGSVLRRSSVDELPQLINVLLGHMSIVGPRPHAVAHNEMFRGEIPPLSRRHKVKPGITGWAQVNGLRGETDTLDKMRRRIEFDLHYVDNWSFWFDLSIIFKTFSKSAFLNAH